MSQVPVNLKYVKSHEWVRLEDDGTVTIGITEHAQAALGDVVFVELPKIGAQLKKGAEAGAVESVKAASDIYSPIDGEIVEVNTQLEDEPELVNSEPYESGWFFRLKPNNIADIDVLLTAEQYVNEIDG